MGPQPEPTAQSENITEMNLLICCRHCRPHTSRNDEVDDDLPSAEELRLGFYGTAHFR
jgi:hypothetical protein